MTHRNVLFESPSELEAGEGGVPPTRSEPQRVAAGLPAVLSTLKVMSDQPGLVRGGKTLLAANQDGGVDCPSCAWPDPEHRSLFEFCENGAKALADETTKAKVGPEFFGQFSVEELSRWTDFSLNRLGRLTEPLYLAADSLFYRPIPWEFAFTLISERLSACSSPDRAVFYTSGRASNEAAFLYGTLARAFGTNNLPDCSNLCHESSGVALGRTIGIGKGTVTLDDFTRTELILVIGQNPGTNHPRMLSALEQAKSVGATIVSINPLAEAGLSRFKNPQDFLNPVKGLKTVLGSGQALADSHLPVRLGGDLALLKGVAKTLLEWSDDGRQVFDEAFIAEKTEGFEEFCHDLRAQNWEELEASSGLEREAIRDLAARVAATERIIVCWAMGLTQHLNSVPTITQIVNLLLLRGAIGKPGAGVCPVRGHSNVQGDRSVGINHRPGPAFLESLGREFEFQAPTKAGFDVTEAIEAMLEGHVDVFMSLGGNFLSASPDTAQTAAGLQRCQLTVSVATKLNRSHLVTGKEALILPCLGRTEIDVQASGPQFVTVENSMGKVHRSRGHLEPASPHLLSEVSIVCELGLRLAPKASIDWLALASNYDEIRDAIERVLPDFYQYNRRVRDENGFYLPNGPREGRFTTPSGKAQFSVAQISDEALPAGHLFLMTMRSHDQFNTTIYGYEDRYRGIKNSRRLLFANLQDLADLGLHPGSTVDLVSNYEGVERRAAGFQTVAYPIPKGCCAAYFPEANPVVPLSHKDPQSGCPASKKIIVRLARP